MLQSSLNASKPRRPLGVWILTIYSMIFSGILPTGLAIWVFVFGFSDVDLMAAVFSLVVTLIVDIGVVISAIGTWQGNNRARIAFLAFITLHYVLIAINNALYLWSGAEVTPELQTRMGGRVFRGVLYPAIYIWYFTSSRCKSFFLASDESVAR